MSKGNNNSFNINTLFKQNGNETNSKKKKEQNNENKEKDKYENIRNILNPDLLETYSPNKLRECKKLDIDTCKTKEYCRVKRTKSDTKCVSKDPYELKVIKKYPICPYHNTEKECLDNKKCSWSKKTSKCRCKHLSKSYLEK